MAVPASSSTPSSSQAACKHLVLDAGPLLSLSPLRGLAEIYYTVPQVLDELKDKRAREHFERLGLSAGVSVQVKAPAAASVSHVIQCAKKTGDYSVLSHADLCVLALTYELETMEMGNAEKEASQSAAIDPGTPLSNGNEPEDLTEGTPSATPDATPVAVTRAEEQSEGIVEDGLNASQHPQSDAEEPPLSSSEDDGESDDVDLQEREPLDVELQSVQIEHAPPSTPPPRSGSARVTEEVYEDPSDEDDGEGEWITPSNVALHKSRALDLLPSQGQGRRGNKSQKSVQVGCMTADFAMQNVLLQMGLSLVGVEGKRIERVKSWVLRCHACFKICKDSSRKFCPSCGSPSLLRASVTISSPNAGSNTPTMQVHLKKNFQFKTRGTIYSIPAPKPGSAKTGPGEGLILREDQLGWMRAKKRADGKREREEKRMLNAASKSAEMGRGGAVLGSWMDPDWVPEMLSVGIGGKGRSVHRSGFDGDMPVIGHGRKNPNERKRRK